MERLKDHLERFIHDKDFRRQLGVNFRGFSVSPDDYLALEAVTEYHAALIAKAQ